MGFWGNALAIEYQAQQELRFDSQAVGMTLFDGPPKGFVPNPGGQEEFFRLYPLRGVAPVEEPTGLPRYTLLLGGLGSGKSKCGAVWLISQALQYPKQRSLLLANSYPQLYASSLVTLVETCREFGVYLEPYTESVEENAIKIANMRRCFVGEERAFVRVLSMGSFMGKTQSSRGQEADFLWLDEGAYASESAFNLLDSRLRTSKGTFCRGLITTSPNGFNWIYDRFADPTRSAEIQALYRMFHLTTRQNVIHLGEAFVSSLEAGYTERLRQQELEGMFTRPDVGLICKYFDRSIHVLAGEDAEILAYDPGEPLHLAFDFNYSPAVCLLSQLRGGEIHFFKELYLLDSDLWALMDAIEEWVVTAKPQNDNCYLYGDASGNNRSVLTRQTAWDIVFERLRKLGFQLHRRFPRANGRIENRVNSMNCALKAKRVYWHKDCKETIKDLETVPWDNDQIDKSDILRSHMMDAAMYQVEEVMPYRNLARPSVGKKALPGVAS